MSPFRKTYGLLVLTIALAACSSAPAAGSPTPSQPSSQPSGQPTQAQSTDQPTTEPGEPTPGTALSACELVTSADIEAAVELDAGTVPAGVLEQQPTVLDPTTNECRYDGDWGGLVVRVTPANGKNTFDAVNKTFGDDAEAIQMGDGALWFEENDRGYFLKGAVMVLLQFTHITDNSLTSFRDPTVALGADAIARI